MNHWIFLLKSKIVPLESEIKGFLQRTSWRNVMTVKLQDSCCFVWIWNERLIFISAQQRHDRHQKQEKSLHKTGLCKFHDFQKQEVVIVYLFQSWRTDLIGATKDPLLLFSYNAYYSNYQLLIPKLQAVGMIKSEMQELIQDSHELQMYKGFVGLKDL